METLAGQVAPGAQVVRLTLNPYSPEASWPVAAGGALAAAEAFAPELLLVAPFQWTPFEELLAQRLEGVRRVGLTGRLYRGDIGTGQENVSRLKLDVAVAATEDLAEVRKNERLASAVLGRPCTLPDPRLEPTPSQTAAAAQVLAGAGLAKGKFWVACVGDAPFTRVRNWSPELWSLVLSRWAEARGDRFLMTGVMSEAETLTRIRIGMGSWASHAIVARRRGLLPRRARRLPVGVGRLRGPGHGADAPRGSAGQAGPGCLRRGHLAALSARGKPELLPHSRRPLRRLRLGLSPPRVVLRETRFGRCRPGCDGGPPRRPDRRTGDPHSPAGRGDDRPPRAGFGGERARENEGGRAASAGGGGYEAEARAALRRKVRRGAQALGARQ